MDLSRINCVICNKSKLKNIYNLENVPISLSCSKEIIKNKSNMSFSQCENCKTIQLDRLIELKLLYSESHNYTSVGETWNNYFNLFNTKIKTLIENKNILEIGCPSGKICLKNNNYNKWFIIEPNKNNNILFNDKIIFIETFFDENFIFNENIDIIIHSHLFEHIYEPNKFLKKCYDILPENGEMIFGVPNMQYLVENNICLYLGIFFEHTIFLNKENITYLLNNNGFDLIEIIDYENHSTIYHVKKNITEKKYTIDIKIKDYYCHFFCVLNDYKLFINNCNCIIEKTKKDVFIFSASYNTQFLLSMEININKIKGILDNCNEKQNKYLYGFELLVYSPEIIKNNNCIVILKNGYYFEEVFKQLKKMNPEVEIIY